MAWCTGSLGRWVVGSLGRWVVGNCPARSRRGSSIQNRKSKIENSYLSHLRSWVQFYVDVGGREEVDFLSNLLHGAVDRIGDTIQKIDDSLGHFGTRALEVYHLLLT